MSHFQVGAAASEPAPRPAPAPVAAPAQPASRPTNRMVQALKSIGRGGAALKPQAVEDGWEEF